MALDYAPRYFGQDFELSEMFEYPYMIFATNMSANVPPGGNRFTWPDVEGSAIVQAYTKYTDLTDNQGFDGTYTIQVDNDDAVNMVLDDLDRVQRLPAVMAQYIQQADRELMWEVNDNIRTEFRDATRLAASGLTQPMRGSHNGLTGNVTDVALDTNDSSAATAVLFSSAAGRARIIKAFFTAETWCKRRGWATVNADTVGAAIIPLEVMEEINEYLYNDKPNMGAGAVVDSAFGLGRVTKIAGFELMGDPTADKLDLDSAGNVKIDLVHPNRRSVFYAAQLRKMETERVQKQFGDRIKALYMHGAIQGASRHMHQIDVTLSQTD